MAPPSIVLGQDTFTVSPLPAMDSFAMQSRIAPIVVELLALAAALLQAGGEALSEKTDLGKVDLSKLDMGTIGPAVARICKAMPAPELRAVTTELLQSATINGQLLAPMFDLKMQGRTVDTWRLLFFAVRVNYPDFFALVGKSGAPAAGAATASPSVG